MHGYELSFFTQQNRRHKGLPLAEWLLREAKAIGAPGATIIAAQEGFGQHGRIHAAHFFELADQPVEVKMALRTEDCERLFSRLRAEAIEVFYIKTPIEFGSTKA